MKVFIAAAVKGPQESKAQVRSSNSNSRGKSLTFPHLLKSPLPFVGNNSRTSALHPALKLQFQLSCCHLNPALTQTLLCYHWTWSTCAWQIQVNQSCIEVFLTRLEHACSLLSTFLIWLQGSQCLTQLNAFTLNKSTQVFAECCSLVLTN